MSQSSNRQSNGPNKKLVYVGTVRLHYGSDNKLRSYNPVMSLEEWEPFLEIFEQIVIIARLDHNAYSDDGYILDHPRIKFIPLPFYDGPLDFFVKRYRIRSFLEKHITDPSATYLTWVPSPIALMSAKRVSRIEAPFIAQVIGDASGVARAIVPRPLNNLAARRSSHNARRVVQYADGVMYVTMKTLQSSYPARDDALSVARTDMKFPSELLAIPSKDDLSLTKSKPTSLIAVGSQQQNYKGHDLLIEAVAGLQHEGYDLSLTLIGSGRLHEHLVRHSESIGAKNVKFIQHLGSSLDVARYVSQFDMFVMPSRTEGMPKALMEAMAVGVLSIGSSVGGIPELLEEDCLFELDSADGLQRLIRGMIDDASLVRQQRKLQAEKIKLVREEFSGPVVMTRFLENFLEHVD